MRSSSRIRRRPLAAAPLLPVVVALLIAPLPVALGHGEADAPHWASVAKALATDAALANAGDNVQNHGGMGFTWEADAHLYLKRAWLLEHTFGARTVHLDTLAAPWRS